MTRRFSVGQAPRPAADPLVGFGALKRTGRAGRGAGCGPGGPPHVWEKCATALCLIATLLIASESDVLTSLGRLEAALEADPDNLRHGNEYRQAVIRAKQYDRCIKFFEKLVAAHPESANAHLNFGFAYVDKIPDAGSISQVILANNALTEFSKALELRPSWIAYYTRGNSYLYWPKIFNRTHLGVADLEQAVKIQRADKKRSYHARAYTSLGDAYWKMDEADRARATWSEGLKEFPENTQLKERLSKQPDEVKGLLETVFDPGRRVDTNLQQLWAEP